MATAIAVTGERRELRLHANILKDIVFRQAGERGKAVLEGVMNSVDAGATRIEIILDNQGLLIKDDGKGFASRQEIIEVFETFGTPHEEGDAVYGQYRMGRGQLFAFGQNLWRSGKFEMAVDAKQELSYHLREDMPPVSGCIVDVRWYNRPVPSDLLQIERGIKEMVRFVAVPVELNGDGISEDPAKAKWDAVHDDYYLRISTNGGVKVYNLGVLVREYSGYEFATGGIVVSRKRLRVNFARNDVQDDCPIWKRVKADLRKRAGTKAETKKRATLGDDERRAFAGMLRSGDLEFGQADTLKLLTDGVGRHWSVQEMRRHINRHGIKSIIVAPPGGDKRSDGLMQRKLAFVLSHDTLERFECRTSAQFLKLMQEHRLELGAPTKTFDVVAKAMSGKMVPIPVSEWTPMERATIATMSIRSLDYTISRWKRSDSTDWKDWDKNVRVILVGESESADAWTDGREHIWFSRRFLKACGAQRDLAGWTRLVTVLVHEYCHDDSTEETHTHGAEFFEEYERAWQEFGPALLSQFVSYYPKALALEKVRVGRTVLRVLDLTQQILETSDALVAFTEQRTQATNLRAKIKELTR
jgi:hypothetical protein